MKIGDRASVRRAFSAMDVEAYAALGGPRAAEGLVPDPLLGALFSYLLGVKLPGPGANYLKQDIAYASPARIGEPLSASVTVTRLRPDRHLVDLEAECLGEDGRRICGGRALLHVSDVAGAFG